jgi:hypothetical protein
MLGALPLRNPAPLTLRARTFGRSDETKTLGDCSEKESVSENAR